MKKRIALACTALLLLTLAAAFAAGNCRIGSETLIVSTWGLSEDALWSEVYEPFEKQYNVKVVLDTGNAQERYTKLKNDPNPPLTSSSSPRRIPPTELPMGCLRL